MPALADIVIKKADGTTNVTYTAIAGAAGDGQPAIFRNNSVGTALNQRPTLLVRATSNGSKTARRVRGDFSWPIVGVSNGLTQVIGRTPGDFSFLVPQNQDEATIKEQAHQFANLVASAIIKACFEEGYAPRGS